MIYAVKISAFTFSSLSVKTRTCTKQRQTKSGKRSLSISRYTCMSSLTTRFGFSHILLGVYSIIYGIIYNNIHEKNYQLWLVKSSAVE